MKQKLVAFVKKRLILSITLLILIIWGCTKLWHILSHRFFSPPMMAYVETIIIKPQVSTQQWESVGTIKAMHDITIDSEVTGTIESIDTADNQPVNQHDILITIKHDDISANLQRDQAILAQKQLYYERLQKLSKTISQESLSVALSEYQQAQSAVSADQAALNKYVIRAPFAGTLGIWQVDIGQLVKPGDKLISLTQLSPAFVDFMLPVKALNNIKVGTDIQFTTPNYPNKIWKGAVVAIDPQLDNDTRGISLRAEIKNDDNQLVPNLYGQVIAIKKLAPQIIIPQEAVIYDPKGTSVYIIREQKAQLQFIQLGTHQANDVVVISGLNANDEVVTAGAMKLFPGMSVKINKQIKQLELSEKTTK